MYCSGQSGDINIYCALFVVLISVVLFFVFTNDVIGAECCFCENFVIHFLSEIQYAIRGERLLLKENFIMSLICFVYFAVWLCNQ
jgi:hypothetical protein